jgi:hypothetical protein
MLRLQSRNKSANSQFFQSHPIPPADQNAQSNPAFVSRRPVVAMILIPPRPIRNQISPPYSLCEPYLLVILYILSIPVKIMCVFVLCELRLKSCKSCPMNFFDCLSIHRWRDKLLRP